MRRFDEEKFIDLMIGYDRCQKPDSAEEERQRIMDFIDDAVRQGQIKVLNEVLPGPSERNYNSWMMVFSDRILRLIAEIEKGAGK